MNRGQEGNASFDNLSDKHCLEIYPKILGNARTILATAKYCALQNNFGLGVSLTILGAEEYLKGTVLYFKGMGINVFQKKELRGVLSNHINRHEFASLIEFVTLITTLLQIEIPNNSSKNIRKSNSAFTSLVKEFIQVLKSVHSASTNIAWWEKANEFKNRGIYSEFKGELHLPSSIKKEEYDIAEAVVADLINSCSTIQINFERISEVKLTEIVFSINKGIRLAASNSK